MTDIEAALREVVRSRAAGLCEYCRILERFTLALIGGYAVGIYGHIRATNDLDIWVNVSPESAANIERALREFGFAAAGLTSDLFLARNNVVRMGVPPIRIEILTSISGVEFESCYAEKETRRPAEGRRIWRTSRICHNRPSR